MSATGFLHTGNEYLDALLHSSWGTAAGQPIKLTYSFMQSAPEGLPASVVADDAAGFAPMSAGQQSAARDAMAAWSAVANITFTEVAQDGDIQLGTNNQGERSGGYASYPDGTAYQTYLFTNNQILANQNVGEHNWWDVGYGMMTLLHELGHVLGLKHPGPYNTAGEPEPPYLPAKFDSMSYTIMSYNPGDQFQYYEYPATPMAMDVNAVQYLYGANMSYHAGADVYRFSDLEAPLCIWDAGGNDTFDFSACTARTYINLRLGSFSSTGFDYYNIALATRVTIETAIAGDGGSWMFGNDADNTLHGGAGSDEIHGGAGNDTISGGGGQDTAVYAGARANFRVVANGGNFRLTDNTGAEGADVLSGVERVRFADGAVALDIDGAAGQTYRLYQAAFNRKPDLGGVGFWLNELDHGLSLLKMAQSFLDSPESVRTYGALDDTAFVNLMYHNVLHRAPDADGLKFYLDGFASGNTRAQVLQGFSESPENQAAIIGSIVNGVDYIPVG
jgi:hypothetical protein